LSVSPHEDSRNERRHNHRSLCKTAAKFDVVIDGDEILVLCTEEPVKGRVNKELVKELSKLFNSKVEIVTGFTSKQKRLLIKGTGKSEVEHLLRVK
jgi:uncharacterized protein (TIGR00251 family)